MSETIKARLTTGRVRRKEEAHYRLLLSVSFVVFLLGAVLARLAPVKWRATAAEKEQRSIVEEARAAARTSVPYVFMS